MLTFVGPAVTLGVHTPPGKVMLALIPVFALLAGLIVYCLVDLIRAPSVRYLPKPVWALIILVASAPFGPLAYLVFGKDRHGHDLGEPAGNHHPAETASDHFAARR